MPGPLPDPSVLDAEASMLRTQAANLHQAAIAVAHRQHAAAKEWDKAHGAELAEAGRQAKAAQQLHAEKVDEAARYKRLAERQEAQAKEAGDTGMLSEAEERKEQAARLREIVKDFETDAREAQIAALEPAERLRKLETERTDLEWKASNAIEKSADQIDEKVRLLAEGAQKQREADAQRDRGDLEGAAESERAARYFIDKADASTIDVSAIEPAVLEEAGVQVDVLNAQPARVAAATAADADPEVIGDEGSTDLDGAAVADVTANPEPAADPWSDPDPTLEVDADLDADHDVQPELVAMDGGYEPPPEAPAVEEVQVGESTGDSFEPETYA